MNKTVKIILIIAAIMVPIGLITTLIGMSFGGGAGWSISKENGTSTAVTGTVKDSIALEEFDSINVEVSSMDVNIVRGDSYKLDYEVRKGQEPEVIQEGGTLTVKEPHKTFILFSFGFTPELNEYTICVPETSKELDVRLTSSSGDIMVDRQKISGNITASSGDVMINDVEGSHLDVVTSSGDINGDKVKIPETSFTASSGEINLLRLETESTGLTTSSGDIDINDSTADKVSCKASSGDVTLGLLGNKDDYSMKLKSSSGDIVINGVETEKSYESSSSAGKNVDVTTSSGEITLTIQ